jgi:nucleotide-binding universal stress UspA family protein
MTYRTILQELRDEPANEARVRAGSALAARFGAELVGIHVAALPTVPVGLGEASAYIDAEIIGAQREANKAIQERVREAFERARDPAVPGRTLLIEDVYGTALAEAARTADLTILGPAHAEGESLLNPPPADEVLVQAGGPVLVLPPGPASLPPGRAVIGWNGSRQAARALKDALPLLVAAREVVVLTLGEDMGGSIEAAARMLGRHEVRAHVESRPEQGPTGRQLLAVAGELGADLLVVGAYSHSRLREAVFGGTTQEILAEAKLPVLFGY